MAEPKGFLIADRERVEAILDELARQLHARLGHDFALVGIRRRGVPLAEALRDRLEELRGADVFFGEIELKRYAEDLTLLHEKPKLGGKEIPFEIEGATVVLMDDVEYTGRTLLTAANVLLAAGAAEVHGAMLASRGDNEVPAYAAFTGLRLDVGDANVIEVHVPPYEDDLAIWILHREDVD